MIKKGQKAQKYRVINGWSRQSPYDKLVILAQDWN
jgi:hypothetical protein